MSLSETLGEWVTGLDAVPPDVLAEARRRLIDWLGCAIAGVSSPVSRSVRRFLAAAGGREEATLLGHGQRLPVASAVFGNAVSGHVLEYDDGHKLAVGHPGAVVCPTALAVGEQEGSSLGDLLLGLVAGYEIFVRLARGMGPGHYRYWHPTATCGAVSAAAVAARLMRLSGPVAANAIALGASQAGGLRESFGSAAKPLNVGRACLWGTVAASLAARGLDASPAMLEGPRGLSAATGGALDPAEALAGLGQEFFIQTAHYKRYACCGHIHSALDALAELLRNRSFPPGEIERIHVYTYGVVVEVAGALRADTAAQATFSLPYCVAVLLLRGRVTPAEFTAECLGNRHILDLAARVRVCEDAAASRQFPSLRVARVEVRLRDGSVLTAQVTMPRGTLSDEELGAKFRGLASPVLGEGGAAAVLNLIARADSSVRVDELVGTLRALIPGEEAGRV